MSIRIALDNAPEFYTNLDVIRGRVILGVSRHENVGAIIVKLEGESKTALAVPAEGGQGNRGPSSGEIVHENHKILYKVAQVFPDENTPAIPPFILAPGQHEYSFRFKIPFNNACGDPSAMASLGGLTGAGGFGSGPSIFGLGGIRVMDGSKQLLYSHVTKTLPPSFTGFPRQAEIRYYIKVTVQRPGLFKENWRYHVGFKFLPIEPPRPAATSQEAYARRPFTFRPRSPGLQSPGKGSFLGNRRQSNQGSPVPSPSPVPVTGEDGKMQPPSGPVAPSVEMSARLPHPPILTCNKPVPLRLVAKKLAPGTADIFLVSLQIDLIGTTVIRCEDLVNTETSRWVIMSRHGLSIPVSHAADGVGAEAVVPEALWRDSPLPNTVMPSFLACNLRRSYQLEIKIGLSCGKPSSSSSSSSTSFFKAKSRSQLDADVPQAIHLPLHFSAVDVYSGLAPPAPLLEAMRRQQQQQQAGRRRPSATITTSATRPQAQRPPQQRPPIPPPRPAAQAQQQQQQQQQPPPHDPLYPPQLAPGQDSPPYDDAPPSYDEAVAESVSGPVVPDGTARPAYSGVTNENGPSTIPEKG
ncbi:hypothetical protein QBC33DRAFT_525816 [Phialemonium atrogriseum]|uniref:Arrestin-like N-terminal domain-containing protein n=1 Tax=Phialemonium atrogriseum TaxID=1093897 RepID=A0AAJ0C6E0_9PEZI|nr:uncharacterized protein QBC33DRAFT_525816 [Phialemonium atrogriseum]KAK1770806.1 hypothetical protein QBC33DRAFT_525816 [Phialemonium atrogriseum]